MPDYNKARFISESDFRQQSSDKLFWNIMATNLIKSVKLPTAQEVLSLTSMTDISLIECLSFSMSSRPYVYLPLRCGNCAKDTFHFLRCHKPMISTSLSFIKTKFEPPKNHVPWLCWWRIRYRNFKLSKRCRALSNVCLFLTREDTLSAHMLAVQAIILRKRWGRALYIITHSIISTFFRHHWAGHV